MLFDINNKQKFKMPQTNLQDVIYLIKYGRGMISEFFVKPNSL